MPALKFYYQAIVKKTTWYCHKSILADQLDRIYSAEIKSYSYSHLILDTVVKTCIWWDNLSNK